MKKTGLILILLAVLALFTGLFGTAAAQSVDVDAMSNEELMLLLQSIMQKLEEDSVTETEEAEPGPLETPVPAAETAVPTAEAAAAGPEKATIYTNKKLIREPLPDSWFIKIESGGKDKKEKNHGKDSDYGGNKLF